MAGLVRDRPLPATTKSYLPGRVGWYSNSIDTVISITIPDKIYKSAKDRSAARQVAQNPLIVISGAPGRRAARLTRAVGEAEPRRGRQAAGPPGFLAADFCLRTGRQGVHCDVTECQTEALDDHHGQPGKPFQLADHCVQRDCLRSIFEWFMPGFMPLSNVFDGALFIPVTEEC